MPIATKLGRSREDTILQTQESIRSSGLIAQETKVDFSCDQK